MGKQGGGTDTSKAILFCICIALYAVLGLWVWLVVKDKWAFFQIMMNKYPITWAITFVPMLLSPMLVCLWLSRKLGRKVGEKAERIARGMR